MTTRLVQKQLLKGSQTFEIIEEAVEVRIKPPLKEAESLSVVLRAINPEPVIDSTHLHFNSRVNGEPLLSLWLAKPNAEVFNAFVSTLKQRAQAEYEEFTGLGATKRAAGLAGNVYEEPPEFDGDEVVSAAKSGMVDPDKLGSSIEMLKQYLEDDSLQPLLSALAALQAEPQSARRFGQVADEFNALGIQQGAVLTYAPYLSVMLYDDPLRG